jgi:hypothetical protein
VANQFNEPASPQEAGFSIWQKALTMTGIQTIVFPDTARIPKETAIRHKAATENLYRSPQKHDHETNQASRLQPPDAGRDL